MVHSSGFGRNRYTNPLSPRDVILEPYGSPIMPSWGKEPNRLTNSAPRVTRMGVGVLSRDCTVSLAGFYGARTMNTITRSPSWIHGWLALVGMMVRPPLVPTRGLFFLDIANFIRNYWRGLDWIMHVDEDKTMTQRWQRWQKRLTRRPHHLREACAQSPRRSQSQALRAASCAAP